MWENSPLHKLARTSTHILTDTRTHALVRGHTLFQPCSEHPPETTPLICRSTVLRGPLLPLALSLTLNLTPFPPWG